MKLLRSPTIETRQNDPMLETSLTTSLNHDTTRPVDMHDVSSSADNLVTELPSNEVDIGMLKSMS